MRSGFYRPGDVLPSITDLAEALGVSRIVTRTAVRKLADERLIYPRPSAGSVVLDLDERRWKGHVLLVRRNEGCGYYDNVFASVLHGILAKEGWLCSQASVPCATHPRHADVSELKVMISSPVSLALILFKNDMAVKLLSESGIPFVALADLSPRWLRECMGCVRFYSVDASEQFAAACSASGVKRVIVVGSHDSVVIQNALCAVGVKCESLIFDEPPEATTPDFFSEAGRVAIDGFLKSGKALPDAFYFVDDYVCAGALAALSDAGIRAPQDVRVATWANRGNVPPYARPLSRIEIDPWKCAEQVSALCLDILSGKRDVKSLVLSPTWIEGETMGLPARQVMEKEYEGTR